MIVAHLVIENKHFVPVNHSRRMSHTGQSLPNCAIRNMSVRHSIADMRADIAGRPFGANRRHSGQINGRARTCSISRSAPSRSLTRAILIAFRYYVVTPLLQPGKVTNKELAAGWRLNCFDLALFDAFVVATINLFLRFFGVDCAHLSRHRVQSGIALNRFGTLQRSTK
jgi:hypothetical protein